MTSDPIQTNASSAIDQWLDEKLPANRGGHTLIAGDNHRHHKHIEWLHDNLDMLQAQHNVGALGLEDYPFFNVFYWAYQDGLLQKELGPEATKTYMQAIRGIGGGFHSKTLQSQSHMVMEALEKHLQVIGYDTRGPFRGLQRGVRPEKEAEFNALIEERAIKEHTTPDVVRNKLRHDENPLDNISMLYEGTWLMQEVEWVCRLNPVYQKRLDAIEDYIALCHRYIKQGKMDSDAASAYLFDAMAPPDKNRVGVIGWGHLTGGGQDIVEAEEASSPAYSYGTFLPHLKNAGHTVTAAVIADKAMAFQTEFTRTRALKNDKNSMVRSDPLKLVNLDKDTIKDLPHPAADDPRLVSLEDKLILPPGLSADEIASRKKTFANPLLLPGMNEALNNVRVAMHGAAQIITK